MIVACYEVCRIVELGLRDDRCELLVWMRVCFALVDVNWRLHQIDSRVGGLARQQLPLSQSESNFVPHGAVPWFFWCNRKSSVFG